MALLLHDDIEDIVFSCVNYNLNPETNEIAKKFYRQVFHKMNVDFDFFSTHILPIARYVIEKINSPNNLLVDSFVEFISQFISFNENTKNWSLVVPSELSEKICACRVKKDTHKSDKINPLCNELVILGCEFVDMFNDHATFTTYQEPNLIIPPKIELVN